MAPSSPSVAAAVVNAPAWASSSRKRKHAARFTDEPLVVVTKRRRAKGTSVSRQTKTKPFRARKTRAPRRKNEARSADNDDVCAEEPYQDVLVEEEAKELVALLGDEANANPLATCRRVVAVGKTNATREDDDTEFRRRPCTHRRGTRHMAEAVPACSRPAAGRKEEEVLNENT